MGHLKRGLKGGKGIQKGQAKAWTHHLQPARAREIRLLRKLTQQEVAIAAKLPSPSTVSLLESGRGDVTGDTLAKLCIALDCSSDYLLGLSENPARR